MCEHVFRPIKVDDMSLLMFYEMQPGLKRNTWLGECLCWCEFYQYTTSVRSLILHHALRSALSYDENNEKTCLSVTILIRFFLVGGSDSVEALYRN